MVSKLQIFLPWYYGLLFSKSICSVTEYMLCIEMIPDPSGRAGEICDRMLEKKVSHLSQQYWGMWINGGTRSIATF